MNQIEVECGWGVMVQYQGQLTNTLLRPQIDSGVDVQLRGSGGLSEVVIELVSLPMILVRQRRIAA